ncbi:hypothetical protein [Epilithonimonas caeni]|uniref:hypothetical protein n=1 Tax=Epilithonimonas caeni TaxID=365343 RepID=UPI00041744BC|nr:hypothetical protein [Epilithonimonas caeni]
MKELTKPCIVVWNNENIIQTKLYDNVSTWHGPMYESAEFDSPEELDQFISDNELIDMGWRNSADEIAEDDNMEL